MTNTFDRTPVTGERKTWTMMVYMAAENSSELDAVAVRDLREMERGVNKHVNVAVQINRAWPAVPQRYEILTSGPKQIVNADGEFTNMGDKETLARFLTWAVREFPARNYCLVLWGHAYGLGFGRDHGDALTLHDLREALEEFRTERQLHQEPQSNNPDGRLELLGANACGMSYVEAAYELRNAAQYLVASQIAVPFSGWPYELILGRINSGTKAGDLGQLVVDAYVSDFNGVTAGERVTMSLLKLGVLSNLAELELKDVHESLKDVHDFKELLQRLAVAIRGESRSVKPFDDRRAYVRDVFLSAAYGDVRPLIDLKDLCCDLSDAESGDLLVVREALLKFLSSFVIEHKGHPELLEDLHGVGIFAPFVADDEDLKRLELQDDVRNGAPPTTTGRQGYEGLALFNAEDAAWPELVYDELRQTADPGVLTRLTDQGASSEDRRDIKKIVLPIESSFNKLDRVLAQGKRRIDAELGAAKTRQSSSARIGLNAAGEKRFAPPYLKLIQTPNLDAQVAKIKQVLTLKALERAATVTAGSRTGSALNIDPIPDEGIDLVTSHPELLDPMRSLDRGFVSAAVDFFVTVEQAVGEAERATRKGLTHARLGLGPSAPDRYTFAEEPKSGHGFAEEEPKSGHGFTEEEPKSGHGRNASQADTGDLRVDLAFTRVIQLFGGVSKSLREVEDAVSELENAASATLSNVQALFLTPTEMLDAAAEGIRRALAIVEEASKKARRTIRCALSHPMYGLGSGSNAIGLDERQALANAGGLSKRTLRLL